MVSSRRALKPVSEQSREGYMPSSYARALLNKVVEHEHDARAFAAEAGLDMDALETANEVPIAVFGRLYQRALLLIGDESLGIVSGGKMPSGTFRMMCLCVIHRPTLGAIVKRAAEFFDVCKGVVVKPQVLQTEQGSCIAFATVKDETSRSVQEILHAEGPIKVRSTLYIWHSLLSWFAGRRVSLISVEFSFAKPANGDKWARLFQCPVVFNCQDSLLRFGPDVMDLPNVQSEQSLSVFLTSAPHRLIAFSFDEERLGDRVRALFSGDLSQRLPNAKQVSSQLFMSVSKMRRHLLDEGTSFQQLKDDFRKAAAMQYLASTDLTFSEIAEQLGFNEVSAFYRAFKRWTNLTPTQYRESL